MSNATAAAETLMQSVQKIRRDVRGGLSIGDASDRLTALRIEAESLPRRHGPSDLGHQFDALAADVERWLAARA